MARVRKSKKSGNSNEIKIIKPRRAYSGINWLELFQTIEGGKRGIISKLAKDLNIPRTTLSSRYHRWLEGGLGIEDTNTGKRNSNRKYKSRLSENQQLQLYEWIIDNRRAGIPISSKDLAREAWQRFLPSRAPRISESWVRRFRKKFHLVLRKSCLHQTLPKDFDARKETEIFHKRCEEIMSVYTYQSIYNMDETNFRFSYPPEKTISPQGAKEVYVNHYGSPKEGCTVVGCIGGDGYKLPLTFIFKGGPRVEKQMRSAIKKGYFYANKAAWMTKVLMKKWFEEVFLKNVATPCALFMDNFKAHFDPDFLTLAEKHHVLIQMIPANLTGQLQPLDKMIFRQLKVKYQRYFEGGIKRGDTAQIKREKVSKACMKMWDQVEGNSVARSFRKTGIIRDNIDSFDRECLELFIEASNSNSKYERKKRKQYKKKKKTNSLESKKEKHPKKRETKKRKNSSKTHLTRQKRKEAHAEKFISSSQNSVIKREKTNGEVQKKKSKNDMIPNSIILSSQKKSGMKFEIISNQNEKTLDKSNSQIPQKKSSPSIISPRNTKTKMTRLKSARKLFLKADIK